VEGIERLVVFLVRKGSFHSWAACQEFAVNTKFWRDGLPLETPAFDEDPIPDDPTGNGEIDDTEFLSEEVRAADLVGVALKIFDPFVQNGGLELRGLSVEDTEVTRDDELVDEIDPDPRLGGLIGVGWYQVGCILGIGIFEELEDDVRVVKGSALMGESGD